MSLHARHLTSATRYRVVVLTPLTAIFQPAQTEPAPRLSGYAAIRRRALPSMTSNPLTTMNKTTIAKL